MLSGMHDEEGAVVVPDGGWCLALVELSQKPGPRIYQQRLKWLVRANWGYGSTGTIPLQNATSQYISALGSFAAGSKNVHGYLIGNEPNHEQERPDGVYITPEHYADTFVRSYHLLKTISSQNRVIVAAMAPYHAQGRPWTQYMRETLQHIASQVTPDGIAIHAYARSMEPGSIISNDMMGAPLAGTYNSFRTYRDALDCIPLDLRFLPVYLTEFNVIPQWEDRNTGIIQAAYREIREWNGKKGNQQIECLLPYRWPKYDRWSISDKPNLIQDLLAAYGEDVLQSPVRDVEPPARSENTISLPSIQKDSNMPSSPSTTFERKIDPRATARGVSIVESSRSQWKVKSIEWLDEAASQGRHHIYFDTVDESGKRLVGVPIRVIWPTGFHTLRSEEKPGEPYSANYPMSPSRNEFSALIEGSDSEMVRGIGMGADTPGGFNAGIHTSTFVVFQKVKPAQLDVAPEPPVQGTVNLSHPLSEVAHRRISQRFGENPQDYVKWGLKGHTGIDFAAPMNTPVFAADAGRVIEMGNDEDGYGLYVKIQHPWGQSLYAHLNSFGVKTEESVARGALLGLSGNSGNSSGPHLHFAIRISPYKRNDGWDGFTNPLPYLTDVTATPGTDLWDRAWPLVLRVEGGLSTDRSDPGNYRPDGTFVGTNWGISALAYPQEDIPNMTRERALFLLKRDYWVASGAANLSWPLALVHFDAYVQNPSAAREFLKNSGGNPVIYMSDRINWYTNLRTWEQHGKGWMRRCALMLREVGKA